MVIRSEENIVLNFYKNFGDRVCRSNIKNNSNFRDVNDILLKELCNTICGFRKIVNVFIT